LPGIPTLRPEMTASMNGSGRPSSPRNHCGSAPAGAVSRPSIVSNSPASDPCTKNPPPPIPELCGSTTVRASIVAIAASVALPPCRRIAAPASAARGSAALTRPAAFAVCATGAAVAAPDAESEAGATKAGVAQAARASGARELVSRRSITAVLFASHGLRNRAETCLAHQAGQLANDPASDSRSFIDHRAVELHQAGPGADPLERVGGAGDTPHSDQRQGTAGSAAEIAQPLQRRFAQRRAREATGFPSMGRTQRWPGNGGVGYEQRIEPLVERDPGKGI